MQTNRRPKKQDKIDRIKRFISGEDITALILPPVSFHVTFFETCHMQDEDRIMIDSRFVTMQEYETILAAEQAKGSLVWVEGKIYSEDSEEIEHSEPLAASGLNDVTGEASKLQDSNEAANEPEKPTREQLHRLYLDAEMKKINEQETIDLQIRDKMLWWSKHNTPQ
jgi:hypothetical protein